MLKNVIKITPHDIHHICNIKDLFSFSSKFRPNKIKDMIRYKKYHYGI